MELFNYYINPLISGSIGIVVGAFFAWRSKSHISSIKDDLVAACDIAQSKPEGEDFKLVLIARSDLGMGKGKIAAQCCHATLSCYKSSMKNAPLNLKTWEYGGQTKVVLKTDSEESLYELQGLALSHGLVAKVVHDAGRTQIQAGSATVLGIGPGPISVIDSVTGHLKLL